MIKKILSGVIIVFVCCVSYAEEEVKSAVMDMDMMESVIAKIDPDYEREGSVLVFEYSKLEVTLVTDATADRMRIVIPIAETTGMNVEVLQRLMQANFDSALDARYAIGQGILWSTFLHRMSSLTVEDFLSGIGQSINIVNTFGTTFTSGELTFGGGDSNEIHRELIDELLRKGTT